MDFLKQLDNSKYSKVVPYLIISVIATAIDLSLFAILLTYFSVHFLIANTLALSSGISTKFSLNKLFTFKERKLMTWQHQFRRFLVVSGGGFILSTLILYSLVDLQNLDATFAKVVATGFVFVYTFVLHNLYSFEK